MNEDAKLEELSVLMQKVQAGNAQAYKDLFDQIGPLITKIIRQRIKDEHTIEDLYQTVLMTLHRARHTYDITRPFKPWLYSIVRNAIFDYLRKNRSKLSLEVLLGDHIEVKSQTDTSTEEMELLQKAMATLPENQREAVHLLKIDGLSLQEASKQTGVSVAAIKVRAHRGYEALKKVLLKDSEELL